MKSKKFLAGTAVAAVLCAVTLANVEAIASTAAPSQSWDVYHIGGGAPDSLNRYSSFYVYNSSAGFIGNCETISSGDTEFGVIANCNDGVHSIIGGAKTWNGKGTKEWKVTGSNTDVGYFVYAYGSYTESTGTISRK